ncbi:MAG: allophycocyanin subunit beta [Cyanobacteria bacterium P01_A01_bin.17]
MQDAITAAITSSDLQGQYLNSESLAQLEQYFQTGELRIKTAAVIGDHAPDIVKDAVAHSFAGANVAKPGAAMHTTRQYAACVRDLDFYLRYATYAMVAGDTSILDERVLNGLKETYHSLGVSITSTVGAIQSMKSVTTELLGDEAGRELGCYLDYICDSLT